MILLVILTYVLSLVALRNINRISSYESLNYNGFVYVIHKDRLRSDTFRRELKDSFEQIRSVVKNSDILTKKRALAVQGVEHYIDWYYSLGGSFIMQGIALIKIVSTVGIDIMQNEQVRKIVSHVSTELTNKIFDQMQITDQELNSLYRLIEHSQSQISSLLSKELRVASPVQIPQSLVASMSSIFVPTIKAGIALTSAVVTRRYIKRLIAKQGSKVGLKFVGQIIEKAILKQGVKSGGRMAAAGSAAAGAALSCAWAGPVAAACALGGAVFVFLGSEYAFNRIDEFLTSDQLRVDLIADIDIFLDVMIAQITQGVDQTERILLGSMPQNQQRALKPM